jgi:hypothetical protein
MERKRRRDAIAQERSRSKEGKDLNIKTPINRLKEEIGKEKLSFLGSTRHAKLLQDYKEIIEKKLTREM